LILSFFFIPFYALIPTAVGSTLPVPFFFEDLPRSHQDSGTSGKEEGQN